ncbi:hypothetical protein BZA77DRAFT_253696 [Pyronema omphalodes]|nr:hypothetical protein BZA77DRAFT_253696 [Pyronema omphalodes]
MVPFPKNDDFIGESHITSWFKAYEKERTTAGKSEHTGHLRLALCGLGGIGKTQDVLNYIYAQQNQRPIFWIHADSIPQFEADYKNLGTHAKIPGLDINDPTQNTGLLVKAWLESPNSGDWILIIDNADNKLNFYPETKHTETQNTESNDIHTGIAEFIPRGSKGTIILTTRDREVAKCLSIPDHHIIQKPEFSSEEAVKLFCQHYSNPDDTADTAALSQLLQELQYLPLAIVQVAVYLDSNRSITINRYLELFRNTKQSQNRLLSNLSTPQLQGYQKNPWRTSKTQNEETILTTFTISFRQLQQQSSLVDQYLRFLACIDRKYIPHDLLLGIRFRTKPFNTNTNPGDEDDQEEANELTLSEAISQLLNHSLLQPITPDATNPSLKTYEIHSLVHLALRTYLKDNNDLDTALSNTSSTLDKILPMPEYNNWTTWRLYLPHVLTLLGNLNQQQESQEPQEQQSQDTASLLTKAAAYLSSTGNYQSALNLHQRAEHIFSHLLPAEDPRTIAAMQRVGDSLYRCGKFHKAVEIQEIVLGIRQRILGGGHRDTLESMERLAGSYQRLGGRGEEVRRLREAVLWGMRKILGEEHPDTLCAVMSLADTMRVQGTGLEEVVRLEEMVLRVRIKVLGEEHSDTLHSMQRLAITYGEIRTREIEVLNKELAEVKGSGVGEEHPDMVRRMKDLGSAYKLLDGRLKEIQGLEEKVLEVRRRTLGEEHPDTLIIMNNLALTYKRQGREKLKEVEELEERILEIRRRTLGEEHPDTLMSMNNLADTYTQRSPGAKMKEVQKLIEKVVEVRRRTLGDDHRDTVDAIYNLAHTLFKLQRLDEAISLMEEVGGAYSRIYGSDHSYTKEVEEYLERWKYVQKKWNAGAQ